MHGNVCNVKLPRITVKPSLAIYMYGDSGFAPMMFVFSGCGKCLLVFDDLDLAAQAELVLRTFLKVTVILFWLYLYVDASPNVWWSRRIL